MRLEVSTAFAVLSTLISPLALSAAELVLPNFNVGRNLQTSGTITLPERAPEAGLEITLTSDDPSLLLLSRSPETAGAASIKLPVRAHFLDSPEFWVHARADKGSATYTATIAGSPVGKGKVTLFPSGILIVGPFKAPRFITTTGGAPSRITLYSVRLDSNLAYAEQQLVAGGLSVKVDITNSNSSVGVPISSQLTFDPGVPNVSVEFKPRSPGETTLALKMPDGFSMPTQYRAVTADVRAPGLALTDQVTVGQNLQVGGVAGLGEAAPEKGVEVTVTSDDPSRLLLSASGKEAGAKSVKLKIPAGQVNARYFLQALSRSGEVTYTASAPGFVSRTAKVVLAPSGVVIAPSAYGPPDEAELHRKESTEVPRGFVCSLSNPSKTSLVVWTVQLDPVTLRSADVTVQPLRPGMSLKVELKSSNPAVGTIAPFVTIEGGSEHATTDFTPVSAGSVAISVITPEGFTISDNSTSIPITVLK